MQYLLTQKEFDEAAGNKELMREEFNKILLAKERELKTKIRDLFKSRGLLNDVDSIRSYDTGMHDLLQQMWKILEIVYISKEPNSP